MSIKTFRIGSRIYRIYKSDAHRHDYVFVFVIAILGRMELCLGISILELKGNLRIADHVQNLVQILCIETDNRCIAGVIGLNGFVRFTFLSILRADYQLVWLKMKTNRMRSLISH